MMRAAGEVGELWVSLEKARPEPWPAKTKIRVEMNSAKAAFRAAGWVASSGRPTAITILWNGMVE